ncbi:MAG: ATP-binding cassette domain-containing protein [Desulfobacteraceae bacterium]|nr:MAG: ATP-binding cassette domain-containing protein [Desulfobacteraceae bacterium]
MRELSCHDLCFSRAASGKGEKIILDRVDCSFPSGMVSLITGVTGAGKSTLLHILAALIRPTSGEVRADGHPVSRWVTAHKDLWRKKIGIVFQQSRLMRGMTSLENVMLPLIPRGSSILEVRRAAMEALKKLRADHLAGERVSVLSGGESQRVAIARAIAAGSEALFADEPTAHQDDESASMVLEVFKEKSRKGAIVVLVAHDHRLLEQGIADRHFAMENGRLRRIV